LQALAESAAQRVRQLEQQVKQLQDTSDANGQVLQGKMANLDGEPKDEQQQGFHVAPEGL
jgi:hypothetical protein